MTIGTKSVLFGAHCFLWHWFFIALGWRKLYGWRRVEIGQEWFDTPVAVGGMMVPVTTSLWDPRLWLAFLLHDIGYLGKPNMDGPEGEQHPFVGARIMRVFGQVWHDFVVCHSRFLAKQLGMKPSPLCFADKYASILTPRWLYLPFVRLTGEIREYMALSHHNNRTGGKYAHMNLTTRDEEEWYRDFQDYVRRWVAEHLDGREDTWTQNVKREPVSESGVWQ